MAENATSTKRQEENKERKMVRKDRKKQSDEASLNMVELRELAELIDKHGFTDFEFENENIRVRLTKTPPAQIVQAAQPVASQPVAPTSTVTETKSEVKAETPHPGAKAETEAAADENLYKITSPIVGTFMSIINILFRR